ncbi:MAG TPA: hypothetical protein VFY29_09505 [Terriglobia bacterium]|nr:hypothetical protein [Terriglobia bacterium]
MFHKKLFRSLGACRGLAVALIAFGSAQVGLAQSTIFNIPTTDVVETKKAYAEFDWFMQAPGAGSGSTRLQTFAPRLVVGVAPGLEAGVNVSVTHTGGGNQSFIQPNAKYKFYSDDDMGTAASAGFVWLTPMNNRSVTDSFALIYGNFSKKFTGGDYGPRITIGPYGLVDTVSGTPGTKAGVIAGYEQPLHSNISFVADWYSGISFFGYFTPGVSITLPHNGLFNAGYAIGNDSYNGNTTKDRLLFLYYGMTFGG